MAMILCVLYDDPIDGYPSTYPKDAIPQLNVYPGGQSLPTPKAIDFMPGQLLGSLSGELGLRAFLEAEGHQLIITSDKDGENSHFEKLLPEAEIVISQPFWPAYLTRERLLKAKKLKLAITAGVGSDHVDLNAAMENNVTVAEVTYCNSISVAEHTVMMILALVRNYLPSHQWIKDGGWHIADCASRSYDIEGMAVGILGAGRIGQAVLKRLHPFDVKLHYTDQYRLSSQIEKELNLTYHDQVESLVATADIISLSCPLHAETENLFNADLIRKMKRGTYLINTARANICDRDAIVAALEEGQLAGYAGDVWYPQPPNHEHPWRYMPHHAMTPHIAGTTLSAQTRYAAGVREILECYFDNRPIRDEYLIVADGQLKGTGAHSYKTTNDKYDLEKAI